MTACHAPLISYAQIEAHFLRNDGGLMPRVIRRLHVNRGTDVDMRKHIRFYA